MSSPAEFTGERFMPECTGEIWAEHWHRYVFASRLVAGLDVLDAACGEGYGAAWLARTARSVTGLDIDAPTVEGARRRYGRAGLSFEAGSVTSMPFADGSFDCVVSFETLEHLGEQREMLGEMRRVLKPDGFLVISTPNRVEYSERRRFHNPFHVRELDADEFRALLAERFPAQRWYGQKLLFHSGIWPLAGAGAPLDWVAVDEAMAMPQPMYYVALAAASDAHLPATNETTLLADPAEAMYREYEQTVARAATLEQLTKERERLIESRDRALAERAAHVAHLEALALARLATIEERDRQLAAQAERAQAMEAVIVERDLEAARRDARIAEAERVIEARDRLLEETNARVRPLESLVAERDAQLAAVNSRIAEAEHLIAERERIIVERDRELAAVNARMSLAETLIAERERIIVERDAQLAAAAEVQRQAAEEMRELHSEVARRASWRWWLALPFVRAGVRAPRGNVRRTG